MTSQTNATTGRTSGDNPVEGRRDLPLPGADVGRPESGSEEERRDELADRVEDGAPPVAATQEPDVLPDVEVPEATM